MWLRHKFKFSVTILALVLTVIFVTPIVLVQSSKRPKNKLPHGTQAFTSKEELTALNHDLRKKLSTLPLYGIFDWVEAEVNAQGRATLRGWVVRPETKSEAEERVNSLAGVADLNNEINVLPYSSNDERLRRSLFITLFNRNSPLFPYALGENPSIHLVVENGSATLLGKVNTEADSKLALQKAQTVPGLTAVRNQLIFENAEPRQDTVSLK